MKIGQVAEAHLRVGLNAHNEKNARAVLKRLAALITFEIDDLSPHHEGGFVAMLRLPLSSATWPQQVFAAIDFAQSFGYGWEISGRIGEELNMSATKFSVSGLTSANLRLQRPDGPPAQLS